MKRITRRLFRPFGRMAAMMLLWEHRRSVAMAVRSIRHELETERRTGFDPARWKALATGLWQSRRAADDGTVKSVIVDDAQRTVALATTPSANPATPPAGVVVEEELRYTRVG
jgi:hypothetical protein